jgi:hypothetical protein
MARDACVNQSRVNCRHIRRWRPASTLRSKLNGAVGWTAALMHEAKRGNLKSIIHLLDHGGAHVNSCHPERVSPLAD